MAPSPPNLPTEPGVVTLTEAERKSGSWSRANLQRALEFMHRDGLLVMSGIIDPADLVKLRDNMVKTSDEIQVLKTSPTQFNHGIKSNFLQAPPLADPDLRFPSVFQNPFCVQIAEGYLGSGLCMPFITANTAIKKTTQAQPIHKDTSFVHPCAPFMMIANFLLSDFMPENGSTEFWLGSHNSTLPVEQMWRSKESKVPTCDIRPEILEERRLSRAPCQVRVPFGSVLFRDVRTWHRGMPNPSDEDRIMVAVAYQSSWFTRDRRFKAPESARALLTGNPKVEPLCDFLPDEKWLEICQQWGNGEPMDLVYGPNSEDYVTISDVKEEDKVLNLNFNEFAKG
ncbi:hypothetical protein T439DRAFT_377223 [Meredithblackwellia eburnea MCA 4105]